MSAMEDIQFLDGEDRYTYKIAHVRVSRRVFWWWQRRRYGWKP